jgi:plastocyanin domain-containing protein
MKKSVGVLLVAGVLVFAGCAARQNWEYETISGTTDRVLNQPVAEGWDPIGICVTPDGQKWFILKRQKSVTRPSNWQYKTVISHSDGVLDNPTNQGWNVIGYCQTADSDKWFLLKKPKT